MCIHEQWWLHCTGQWGQKTPVTEHMYYVVITFKMTEQVEQQICIRFCVKLEHFSVETIWTIQKAAAMGNWWLAASSWLRAHSRIVSCTEFFGETSNHPGDSAPLQPRFGDLQLFPKLKSLLKEKRFQTICEIQENISGQLMATGRTAWGPKVPTLKGTEVSLSYVQFFLYVVSSSINVSIFILHGWTPSGQILVNGLNSFSRR